MTLDPRYHTETSPLIYTANQWTGFYIIVTFFTKKLSFLQRRIYDAGKYLRWSFITKKSWQLKIVNYLRQKVWRGTKLFPTLYDVLGDLLLRTQNILKKTNISYPLIRTHRSEMLVFQKILRMN